jgi:hypothetical protein
MVGESTSNQALQPTVRPLSRVNGYWLSVISSRLELPPATAGRLALSWLPAEVAQEGAVAEFVSR